MDVPNSVKLFISRLVPASVMSQITSFVLNDNHPLNPLPCDIIVGTKRGELLEFKDRQVLKSLNLPNGSIPKEMVIYRNHKNIPYNLILCTNALYIVSTQEELLLIVKVISEVNRVEVNDFYCTGEASVRIWCEDDPIAVELDEQFNSKLDRSVEPMDDGKEGCEFINALKRKLYEAKYHVAHNNEKLNEVLKFRHDISHTIYEGLVPGEDKQIPPEGLSAETEEPWLRHCNGKLVIGVNLINKSQSNTIHGINMIILRGNISKNAYKTYMYEHKLNMGLACVRKNENIIEPCSRATLVSVMDADLQEDVKFNMAVAYEIDGQIKYLPMKEIMVKTLEVIQGEYDIMKTNCGSSYGSMDYLAISAVMLKTSIKFTPLPTDEPKLKDISTMFTKELGFADIRNEAGSILIHKSSPFHPLDGILISFRDDGEHLCDLYSRNKSQAIVLIKLIYELVPLRIAVTTPDMILESLDHSERLPEASSTDDHIIEEATENVEEVSAYGRSLYNQMSIVLQYFDDCIICMGNSSDVKIRNLVSQKIDLKSQGLNKFNEFCNNLRREISNGNKCI